MVYLLPPDVEKLVKQRVAAGAYDSEDEVLSYAMEALEQWEQDRIVRWEAPNQLAIDQGARGESKPLDSHEVLARLRARLAEVGILD